MASRRRMVKEGIIRKYLGATGEKWLKVIFYIGVALVLKIVKRPLSCLKSLCIRRQKKFEEEDVRGKIVVVTGANRGIGKELAIMLAERRATVIMACRDGEAARRAVGEIRNRTFNGRLVIKRLDLGSTESIRRFAEDIRGEFQRIDILVNNAGVLVPETRKMKTMDGLEINFGLNHVGHFLLTQLLLDLVKKSSSGRIVNLSSVAMKNQQLDFDKPMKLYWKPGDATTVVIPYSNSKYAIALLNFELARRLEGTSVNTYAVCPGIVATDIDNELDLGFAKYFNFVKHWIFLSPKQGAIGVLYCVTGKRCAEESGQLYRRCDRWGKLVIPDDLIVAGPLPPINSNLSKQLWEKTEEILDAAYAQKTNLLNF